MLNLKNVLRKEGRIFVSAVCDRCGKNKHVRRSWAENKFKQEGLGYLCRSCTSSINIRKARRLSSLQGEYMAIFLEVYGRKWDDKDPQFVASELHTTSINLIKIAQSAARMLLDDDIPDKYLDHFRAIKSENELYTQSLNMEEEFITRSIIAVLGD